MSIRPSTFAMCDLDEGGLCDDERLYYTTDANMNVTALFSTAGVALERYTYDAYGHTSVYDPDWESDEDGTDYDNVILFAGYYRDPETWFYHVRNRFYDAELGRWLARDPQGYVDGMSLYQYVASRPISLRDFLGMQIWERWRGRCISQCRGKCDEWYPAWYQSIQFMYCFNHCKTACTGKGDVIGAVFSICPYVRKFTKDPAANCACAMLQVLDAVPGVGERKEIVYLDLVCGAASTLETVCDVGEGRDFLPTFAMSLRAEGMAALLASDYIVEAIKVPWQEAASEAVIAVLQNVLVSGNPIGPQWKCACDLFSKDAGARGDTAGAVAAVLRSGHKQARLFEAQLAKWRSGVSREIEELFQ